MAIKKWAFIYQSPGFNSKVNVAKSMSESCEVIFVGIDVSLNEDVLEIAKNLVAEGVQFIELCGGFGSLWVAKISEAIENKIPVGSVFYSPESYNKILEIVTK